MKLLFLLFLSFQLLAAQKVVKKSLVNKEVEAISIDAANCYEVVLATTLGKEMVLEATIDGEYKNDLVLDVVHQGRTLLVSSGFQPVFEHPNDKLSTHKVISIALKIYLPEYKNVAVFGRSCNVAASGNYKDLKITLNDGNCELTNIAETITVQTQSGHILVAANGGKVDASSKYGIVENQELPKNNSRYSLTSITGNIKIKKTE